MTRTIPKFNGIVVVTFKKLSKFARNNSRTSLVWVRQRIKNSFSSMDRVYGYNNMINVKLLGGLVYTTL